MSNINGINITATGNCSVGGNLVLSGNLTATGSSSSTFTNLGANNGTFTNVSATNYNASGYIQTGVGYANRDTNSGRIGYGLYTGNALDVIGGNAGIGGNRTVKIWDSLIVPNDINTGLVTSTTISNASTLTSPIVNSTTLTSGVINGTTVSATTLSTDTINPIAVADTVNLYSTSTGQINLGNTASSNSLVLNNSLQMNTSKIIKTNNIQNVTTTDAIYNYANNMATTYRIGNPSNTSNPITFQQDLDLGAKSLTTTGTSTTGTLVATTGNIAQTNTNITKINQAQTSTATGHQLTNVTGNHLGLLSQNSLYLASSSSTTAGAITTTGCFVNLDSTGVTVSSGTSGINLNTANSNTVNAVNLVSTNVTSSGIVSTALLNNSSYIQTGSSNATRDANSGRIGYNLFGQQLDIVGSNGLTSGSGADRKVKVWDSLIVGNSITVGASVFNGASLTTGTINSTTLNLTTLNATTVGCTNLTAIENVQITSGGFIFADSGQKMVPFTFGEFANNVTQNGSFTIPTGKVAFGGFLTACYHDGVSNKNVATCNFSGCVQAGGMATINLTSGASPTFTLSISGYLASFSCSKGKAFGFYYFI
jgi:hypothetical protein